MLIPNIHMETPNYSIVRLRSGDEAINEEMPSYRMVEKPAETAAVKGAAAEDLPQRQIAAVRGIPAGQPAPLVNKIESKPGLFGKIKNWLAGLGETQEEVIKPKPRPARNDKRREPRGEGRNEGRGASRSEGRGEGRGEGRNEGRGEGRSGQKPRGPVQPQAKKEVSAPQEAGSGTAVKSAETEGQEPRSRRGRRGGRRERGERQEAPRNIPGDAEIPSAQPSETAAPVAAARPRMVTEETAPQNVVEIARSVAEPETVAVVEAPHAPTSLVTEAVPVMAAPVEIAAVETPLESAPIIAVPEVAAVAVPVEAAPIVSAPAEIASVAAPVESKPRAPRRRAPQASQDEQGIPGGLVMVETSPDKIKPIVELAADTPAKPRPRRAPRVKVVVEESAPLVQVETQK